MRAGRFAEAEPMVVGAYEVIQTEFGDAHGRTLAALRRVIAVFEGLGLEDQAAEYRSRLPGEAGGSPL
jgi:hypothetical protein